MRHLLDWGRFAWLDHYQPWLDAGGELNVSFMLPAHDAFGDWSSATSPAPADRARAWARSIAEQYGRSSATPILTAAEIGNEPSPTNWPDDLYEQVFVAIAEGFAEGDPELPAGWLRRDPGQYAELRRERGRPQSRSGPRR